MKLRKNCFLIFMFICILSSIISLCALVFAPNTYGKITKDLSSKYNDSVYAKEDNNKVWKNTEAIDKNVVKNGNVGYESLAEAITAAQENDTLVLNVDLNLDTAIQLTKSVTIDGNNHKIKNTEVADSNRVFNITNVNGLTITLKNMTMEQRIGGASRGVSLDNTKNITLNIENCTVDYQKYAINIYLNNENTVVNVKDSTVSGYCAIQSWSSGSIVNVENSTLIGKNIYSDNGSNDFSAIVINKDAVGTSWNFVNTIIKAEADADALEYGFSVRANNSTIKMDKDCKVEFEGEKTAYIHIYDDLSNIVVENNGTIEVSTAAQLTDLLSRLVGGENIKLTQDITTDKTFKIIKSVTIDGDNHTIKNTATDDNNRVFNISDVNDLTITLKNMTMEQKTEGSSRGVSIYNANNITLNIENCTVDCQKYAINIASKNENAVVNVKDSIVSGYCAIQSWSSGSIVNVENSTLTGKNIYSDNGSNDFSAVVINKDAVGTSWNFVNTTIKAEAKVGAVEYVFNIRANDSTITMDKDSKVEFEGEKASYIRIYDDLSDVVVTNNGTVSNPYIFTALQTLIEDCQKLLNSGNYTLKSINSLNEVIVEAKEISNESNYYTISSEKDKLESAKTNLVKEYKTGLSIGIIGGDEIKYTVNNIEETTQNGITNKQYVVGSNVQVTACAVSGKTFLYWKNADDRILSENINYSFYLASNTSIYAVYRKDSTTDNKFHVIFKDYDGKILFADDVEKGQSVTAPTHRLFAGLTFDKWNSDDYLNVQNNLVITATYIKSEFTVKVVENTGHIDSEETVKNYSYGDLATIYALDSKDGKYFSGWYNNNILVSMMKEYRFFVSKDATYEARYEANTESEVTPILSIDMQDRVNTDNNKQMVAINVVWSVPTNYVTLEAGLVRTFSEENKDNLTLDKVDKTTIIKNSTSKVFRNGTYAYTLTMGELSKAKNLYAVGFMTYKNVESGEIITVYTTVCISLVK